MSDEKLIAKNFALLYVGEIIGQILSFFLVIAIAHYFGDMGLGKYSFSFSFVTLFLIIADMGLPTLITKQIAKDKKFTHHHLTKTFTLKFLLNIATLIITIVVIYITRRDYETILFVALAAVAMFFFNLAGIYRSVFQAYEIMKYEAYLKIVERAIATIIAIFLFYKGYGLIALFLILIFSNAIYYFSIFVIAKTKIASTSLSIDLQFWKKNLKEAMPFWITIFFITFYFKIDTIMLTFMKGFEATGWYSAALKIVEVITRVPFLLNVALFPALSRLNTLSYSKTKLLYEKSFYYMVLLALPVVTGLTLLADRIILYFYSQEFVNSIIALQILSASLIFVFVNYLMGYLLNAINKEKLFTLSISITTIINVILNFILIPKYSYAGAAFATLICEVINFGILYYFTLDNNFKIDLAKTFYKPFLANLVVLGLILYLKHLHLILIVILCAVGYFAALFLIKGVGKEEINVLRSLMQTK